MYVHQGPTVSLWKTPLNSLEFTKIILRKSFHDYSQIEWLLSWRISNPSSRFCGNLLIEKQADADITVYLMSSPFNTVPLYLNVCSFTRGSELSEMLWCSCDCGGSQQNSTSVKMTETVNVWRKTHKPKPASPICQTRLCCDGDMLDCLWSCHTGYYCWWNSQDEWRRGGFMRLDTEAGTYSV